MRPNGDEPAAMAGSGGGNRSSDGWVVGRGVQGEVGTCDDRNTSRKASDSESGV